MPTILPCLRLSPNTGVIHRIPALQSITNILQIQTPPIKGHQLRESYWTSACSVVQQFPPEGTEDV